MPDSVREKKRVCACSLRVGDCASAETHKTASKHSLSSQAAGLHGLKCMAATSLSQSSLHISFCAWKYIEKAQSLIKLHNLRINVNLPAIKNIYFYSVPQNGLWIFIWSIIHYVCSNILIWNKMFQCNSYAEVKKTEKNQVRNKKTESEQTKSWLLSVPCASYMQFLRTSLIIFGRRCVSRESNI